MSKLSTKAGHFLARVLGIRLEGPTPFRYEIIRGESSTSVQTVDTETFVERLPSTAEWVRELGPSGREVVHYLRSLFPFLRWISHYNLTWLAGDVVAGITIGAVVVPQGMAYALLANLPPQFGLYSSFMGVVVYWVFGTSKDITIGPVAVMSTLVGNVVAEVRAREPDLEAHVIASALSVIAGCIICFVGLVRCGWIVDLISLTSLSAFMTGSAITIAVSQVPTMMGITGFSNRDSPYIVLINTLKNLDKTKIDAAMGLSALLLLYLVRFGLSYLAKRSHRRQRLFFFLNTLRSVFVILLYTMISWLVNMHRQDHPAFRLLGTIPRGFQVIGIPVVNSKLVGHISRFLPASIIVLLVEHIAISKSFGRINNYTIDPSQEMVAIGVTNMLGPFLGAYPATGSFSRTAIKSKAGVRTPAAGVVTGIVVLLASYALPTMFFYIPCASLAAVIIHAVIDLVTPPDTVYQFWRVSPLEVFIFFLGVIVSIFATIEDGIYATVCISAVMLLYRSLRGTGSFLGKVKVHSVLGGHVIGDDHKQLMGSYGTFTPTSNTARNIFLPIGDGDGSTPEIEPINPYPGIFIYRFSEGFNYPNASHTLDFLTNYIFAHTHRTTPLSYDEAGSRPWNDPGPSRSAKSPVQLDPSADRPTLKAVILDCSSVNNVDITSVQRLIDVRNQLDRYAAPDTVDWHIACIRNRWTRRALVSAGFGYPPDHSDGRQHRWRSIFSVADIGGSDSAAEQAETEADEKEAGIITPATSVAAEKRRRRRRRGVIVHGPNQPLFHVDLTSALQSAIANVEARTEAGPASLADVGTAGPA